VKFASQLKSDEVMMALTIAALAYRVVDKFEHDITSIIYINWLEILNSHLNTLFLYWWTTGI
jgi:hypothetical protein